MTDEPKRERFSFALFTASEIDQLESVACPPDLAKRAASFLREFLPGGMYAANGWLAEVALEDAEEPGDEHEDANQENH